MGQLSRFLTVSVQGWPQDASLHLRARWRGRGPTWLPEEPACLGSNPSSLTSSRTCVYAPVRVITLSWLLLEGHARRNVLIKYLNSTWNIMSPQQVVGGSTVHNPIQNPGTRWMSDFTEFRKQTLHRCTYMCVCVYIYIYV